MAIARINGGMLQSNLERQGINLAIDGNLMYFDVNNRYVGIVNTSPAYPLDSPGNARLANLLIQGNTITANTGKVNFGNVANITITGGSPNYILYTDGNGGLAFGNLSQLATLEVFTGNNVVLGTNTVGALSGNAGAFTTLTSVTDSIATLNQILGNITNSGGNTITISGNITAGNVLATLRGNLIGNLNGNSYGTLIGTHLGNIQADLISPYVTSVTAFNSSTAIKLPVGSVASRPTGVQGYLRYNSDVGVNTVEYYDGSNWVPFKNTISDLIITPDGINASYSLGQTATQEGLLVSINGTVQRPGSAYTVSGSTITFTEIPLVTDIIDVRFIASASTATLTGLSSNISTSGNLTAGNISTGSLTLSSAIQFANLTTTQINTIASPSRGMTVYNYTTGNIQVYNGTKWANVTLS